MARALDFITLILKVPGAGPGAFDFKQGDTNGTIFWRIVRHFLKEPSEEQVACQAPKPIILDTGSVHVPYEWCAVPLQNLEWHLRS